MVPQVVLIDRKGMIVAQSASKAQVPKSLQLEESSLRKKITDLLDVKMTSKKASH